jgi:hypothetical protein
LFHCAATLCVCCTEAKDSGCGIPQGSPISPLLANLYMRRFVLGWNMLEAGRCLGSVIVTYAEDLVVLCWRNRAEEVLRRCASSWASWS